MYYHVMLTADQLETLTAILDNQREAVNNNLNSSDPLIQDLRATAIKEIDEIQASVDDPISLLSNSKRTLPASAVATSTEINPSPRRRTSRKTTTTEPSGGLDKQSRKSVD